MMKPKQNPEMEMSESQRSTVSADLECTDVASAGSSTAFVSGALHVIAGAGHPRCVREGSNIIRRLRNVTRNVRTVEASRRRIKSSVLHDRALDEELPVAVPGSLGSSWICYGRSEAAAIPVSTQLIRGRRRPKASRLAGYVWIELTEASEGTRWTCRCWHIEARGKGAFGGGGQERAIRWERAGRLWLSWGTAKHGIKSS